MTDTTEPKGAPLSTASAKERAAQAAAVERARRQRAARDKIAEKHEADVPRVKVRVTHKGDGLVSTGQHVGGIGEAYYEKGEVIDGVLLPTAEELQERGLVEILS